MICKSCLRILFGCWDKPTLASRGHDPVSMIDDTHRFLQIGFKIDAHLAGHKYWRYGYVHRCMIEGHMHC